MNRFSVERQALALRGNAGSLSTLIRGGARLLMLLPVRWQGSGDVLASYRPRVGGLGDIRLALPPKTPPGRYEATVLLPDGEQPLVLEVTPRPGLGFQPRTVSVTRGTATVTARNEGNTSIEIPGGGDVALYERLAGEFAGTIRLSVESGKGPLGADQARELTIVAHLPEELRLDTTYHGAWNFDGASLAITVRKTATAP